MLATGLSLAVVAGAAARGLARRFAVLEDSMRPALEPGDWLITQCYRGVSERGDVVVFTGRDDSDRFDIKRIVGLPGEHISISDGQVHIDGITLAEPWANGPAFPDGDDEIPDDAVWVLGDNRALSSGDSRSIGAVPLDDIEWKAVAIYWPASRVGLV